MKIYQHLMMDKKSLLNRKELVKAVDNDQPSTGGRGSETLEEIRENAH